MTEDLRLSAVLQRLEKTIASRRSADPESSYTASLLHAGVQRCAKKFGEEAVEATIAAVAGNKKALTEETADVLYHLIVLLNAAGVSLDDVAGALAAREGTSGHEEKAGRQN
ncbi:MAG: phosphoribosyl-ATP diphosphatase [Pseudomonadota bacterium]